MKDRIFDSGRLALGLFAAVAAALIAAPSGFAQSEGDIRNMELSSTGTGSGLVYSETDPTLDFGARVSGGVDWTVVPKKLSLSLDEELRVKDNFSNLSKAYTNLGAEYKLLPWLKAGASYSFIAAKSSAGEWRMRHRGAASLTASVKAGRWKFALREKVQATYKDYEVNTYQSPQTDLALKTRLKVSYNIRRSKWTPWASVEMRNTLNAVNPDSFVFGTYKWEKYSYIESTDTYDWVSKSRTCYGNLSPSYSDIYINRLRVNIGTEWRFTKNQLLNMYVVADWNLDMPVDFSSSGIQKSYSSYMEEHPSASYKETPYYNYGIGILTLEDSFFVGLCIAYRFKL